MDELEDRFNSMLRRIHFFPSVTGLFPLYVRNGRYEIGFFILFLSIVTKISFFYEAFHQLYNPPIITKGMSKFYKFFTIANYEYNFGVSCYTFAKVFFTRNEMNEIFRLMLKSDVMLSRSWGLPDYGTNIVQDGLVLFLMSLPMTIRFLALSSLTFAGLVEQIYLTFVNFSMYLSIAPFLQLALILKKRFKLLHRSLLDAGARKQETKVEQLIILHTTFCDISAMLNDCFSQQILLAFTVTFTSVVLGSYRSTIAYVSGSGALTTMLKALIFTEYAVMVLIITMICESTSSEAKEFNAVLYQVMIDDKTNDIATNKKLQLHIAMKREVLFTACGFFPLDYTLIHSMIAAATTYLVILIQFGQSSTTETPILPITSFPNSTLPTVHLTTAM